jgi:Flp pilus assembly protein TadG
MRAFPHIRDEQPRGATLVEMAFAVPVFLLLLFAMFEYGRFFMVRHVMDSAAREAARYAIVNTDVASVADVNSVATQQMNTVKGGLVGQTWTTDVFWINSKLGNAKSTPFNNAPFGESIGVTVDAKFKAIFPMVFGGYSQLDVKSASYMLSEGN